MRALTLLALACVLARGAEAQAVVGRVVDSGSGAAVPRARVVATGGDRPSARTTHSDADGRFSLVLGGGAYRLEVTRIGYRNARPRTISVGPGETVRVAVPLSAAALVLDPVSATARPRRMEVDGFFEQLRPDSANFLRPASARGAWGGVQVFGTFPTPSACYQLAAAAHREKSVLTLVVQGRPDGEECMDTGGLFSYKATVRGVRHGTYTLRIVHAYRDDVWESALALDTTVAVR
ncbi:MAG TPA: carboxypeptidase-like regulatory domain-containing protein [Longimicrobium sp.]